MPTQYSSQYPSHYCTGCKTEYRIEHCHSQDNLVAHSPTEQTAKKRRREKQCGRVEGEEVLEMRPMYFLFTTKV